MRAHDKNGYDTGGARFNGFLHFIQTGTYTTCILYLKTCQNLGWDMAGGLTTT